MLTRSQLLVGKTVPKTPSGSRRCIIPPNPGDPRSPHYSDLYLRWVADGAFPLLYSRRLIEAVAEQRILLRPAAKN